MEFPEIGGKFTLPLDPDKPEGAKLTGKLVGQGVLTQWQMRQQKARLLSAKKMAGLREGTTEKTAPELWGEGLHPDCFEDLLAVFRDVVKEAFDGLEPVTVGGKPLSAFEGDELVKVIEAVGLLPRVATRLIDGQTPTTDQLLPSGS